MAHPMVLQTMSCGSGAARTVQQRWSWCIIVAHAVTCAHRMLRCSCGAECVHSLLGMLPQRRHAA